MSRPDLGPIKTISVRIMQEEVGWKLCWSTGQVEHHATAVDAMFAAKEMGRILAQAGISNAVVIDWIVRKAWAKAVVEALGETA